jgi:BR serine/threonine kinase
MRVLLHKVKHCHYEMPDFPADCQDLIRRILVVDPAKRISLRNIKLHPFFRRGLSVGYELLRPIPFSQFSIPIEMESLAPDVLAALRQIGFRDNDELRASLASSENTMAKVFVSVMTTTLNLEALD